MAFILNYSIGSVFWTFFIFSGPRGTGEKKLQKIDSMIDGDLKRK